MKMLPIALGIAAGLLASGAIFGIVDLWCWVQFGYQLSSIVWSFQRICAAGFLGAIGATIAVAGCDP